jgi:predicted PurR-regulated permease PerM
MKGEPVPTEIEQSEAPPLQGSFLAEREAAPASSGSWLWNVTAGAAALSLGVGLLAVIWFLIRPLGILLLGLTLAAALSPIVSWLERWTSRTLATILVYLLLLLILLGLGWIVFPILIDQAGQMIDRVPELVDQAQGWLEERLPVPAGSTLDTVLSQITNIASTIIALPFEISSSILDIFLVAFLSLYTLIIAPRAQTFVLSLFPEEDQPNVNDLLRSIAHSMGGYIRGATISGVVIGTVSYIGLLIIGVNFPLVLGIIAGLLEFIPMIGPLIAGILMVLIAFLEAPTKALITVVFTIALGQLEGNIIAPNVMHPQTNISPLMTLFSIFAGWSVGGVLGALIAIPITAALHVFVVKLIAPAIRRKTGAIPAQEVEET